MDDMSDGDRPGGAEEKDPSSEGWIQWFTSLEGHEYMVEVDLEYIRDPFNLYGL